ncbi:Fanconi anemia group J protein [Boothiomyces sp. JEL0866]|nr:Fanconi anemia group J protein [Boothiomyces sp. JEL0866]
MTTNRKRKIMDMWPDIVKNEKEVQRLKNMEEFKKRTLNNQVHFNILGVPVDFPFNPYNSQMDIMTKELVQEGNKRKQCPYYASRLLAAGAEVVFAPYNYIIEPLIRKSCDIRLQNTVLIFDEAHNIEGICADSGSVEIPLESIELAKANLKSVEKCYEEVNIAKLVEVLENLTDWIDDQTNSPFPEKELNKASKIWSGYDATALFQGVGVNIDNLNNILADLQKLNDILFKEEQTKVELNEISQSKQSTKKQKLAVFSVNLLTELFMIVEYLLFPGNSFETDYKMILSKEAKVKNGVSSVEYVLNFRCLNPGVIFQDIAAKCRSVILTSGTLAPLDTYESELRAKFHDSLEASHVIKKEQIFVGLISQGLDGKPLTGDYQTFRTVEYQDQVGMTIYRITKEIPNGILIFVPAYSWIDTLERRWVETGLWNTFERSFAIYKEPRKTKKGDLEKILKEYNASCRLKQTILFCVFRGKMSEGIDFANERARGVLCIGLPFPNIADLKVKQKRIYNDAFAFRNNLLTGSEWFEIQAFRALNQALGRCIRHLNDWGCVFLIDARFSATKNIKMLPKWIQPFLQTFKTAKETEKLLKPFIKNIRDSRIQNSIPTPAKSPLLPSPTLKTPKNSRAGLGSFPIPDATPVKLIDTNHFETPSKNLQTAAYVLNSHSSYFHQASPPTLMSPRTPVKSEISIADTPTYETNQVAEVVTGSFNASDDCEMPGYFPEQGQIDTLKGRESKFEAPSVSLDLSRFLYNPSASMNSQVTSVSHIEAQVQNEQAIPEENYEEKEYYCYCCGSVIASAAEEHSWDYPFLSVLGYTSGYCTIKQNITGMALYSGKYGVDIKRIGNSFISFYECFSCSSLTGILVDDVVLIVDKI